MPRKIRQLKADLRRAGFVPDTDKGKGSHVVWEHPDIAGAVTLSGKDGADARQYQEADVRKAIARVQQAAQSSRWGAGMDGASDNNELTPEELATARPYPLLIEWSPEDEAFIASVPDMPGVRTHGATREEAAAMGDEVVAVVLGYMQKAARPIPPPSPYSGSDTEDDPPAFSADRIREVRRRFDVTQEVFAQLLNVSVATVRAWEQDVWPPDGAATRLLGIAERHPEAILDAASAPMKLTEMTSARAS